MILYHHDSDGQDWYFRINATRNAVAAVSKKLRRATSRVCEARRKGHPSELSRATLAEAVALADLQAYNGATVDDFNAAPRESRFIP